ncbi:hypothetical protein IIC45_02035 [Patescibacteria group bacterium]|nr:hypothetical protein [Patescibacteria group bacterium]
MFDLEKKTATFTFLVFFTALVFFSGTIQTSHASFLDIIRAFVTINPLKVEVSAPAEVELNKVFKVDAKVINKGEVKIENLIGEIFLPPGLSLSGKSEIKTIRVVPAGREKKISWQVKGESIGNYVIAVFISGTVSGDAVSADGSKLVRVVKKTPPPGRLGSAFQSIFTFIQNLLQSRTKCP